MRVIGLAGRAGAGKNTVASRIEEVSGEFVNAISFAGPLKRSIAATLGIDERDVDAFKDSPSPFVYAYVTSYKPRVFSMRQLLQNYGTACRETFGEFFWVEMALGDLRPGMTNVFTDVRYPNEAEKILEMGGQVWYVDGIVNHDDPHPSEERLPDNLISAVVLNHKHHDSFKSLDNTIRFLLEREEVTGLA